MSKSSANNKLISKRPYGRFFVYTIIAYALLFDAYIIPQAKAKEKPRGYKAPGQIHKKIFLAVLLF